MKKNILLISGIVAILVVIGVMGYFENVIRDKKEYSSTSIEGDKNTNGKNDSDYKNENLAEAISYNDIEKNRDDIISSVEELNKENSINFSGTSFSPNLEGGDWFCYENTDVNLKEGYTFWRYKIILNSKRETTRNEILLEYKIDKGKYKDKNIDIEKLKVFNYGEVIIGKIEKNIDEVNSAINDFILNDNITDYVKHIDYENKNGKERLSIFKDRIEYVVLSNPIAFKE